MRGAWDVCLLCLPLFAVLQKRHWQCGMLCAAVPTWGHTIFCLCRGYASPFRQVYLARLSTCVEMALCCAAPYMLFTLHAHIFRKIVATLQPAKSAAAALLCCC
jgi:hypothetical protein